MIASLAQISRSHHGVPPLAVARRRGARASAAAVTPAAIDTAESTMADAHIASIACEACALLSGGRGQRDARGKAQAFKKTKQTKNTQ